MIKTNYSELVYSQIKMNSEVKFALETILAAASMEACCFLPIVKKSGGSSKFGPLSHLALLSVKNEQVQILPCHALSTVSKDKRTYSFS